MQESVEVTASAAVSEPLFFESRMAFREWLQHNHQRKQGVWLLLGKSGKSKSLTAEEGLEEALCYGWIDGQLKSVDETRYQKKFAPRQATSRWSDKNKALVEQLETRGLMTEYGRAKVEAAKQNGMWDKPKDEAAGTEQIEAFIQLMEGKEPAYTNLCNMSASVKRTYATHYWSAKKEGTRLRRLEQIIARLTDNLPPM